MVKRSGESFSTPPRACRPQPLGDRRPETPYICSVTFRQSRWGHLWATCFRSSLQRPSILKSSGPEPPGPKPPVNRHDLKHTQPSRTSPSGSGVSAVFADVVTDGTPKTRHHVGRLLTRVWDRLSASYGGWILTRISRARPIALWSGGWAALCIEISKEMPNRPR